MPTTDPNPTHAVPLAARPPVSALCTLALLASTTNAQPTWTHYASTPARVSTTDHTPPLLSTPLWTAITDTAGNPIEFAGPTGVVVDDARAYALGESADQPHLYAFDRQTGDTLWQSPIDAPYLDSWSTPAIDEANHALLVASGETLHAIDTATGAELWQADLPGPVVNASPLVTPDLGPADRVLITTFDGFGTGAELLCVNADPFDAALNPYQPGEILWAAPIGASSGNTPAYADATVYVATADEPGRVLAFDAAADDEPEPLWSTDNPDGHPFFAGVCVDSGALYAASYAFSGGQLNANLLKLDAADGSVEWSTPAGRTASTPVPLPDSTVLLSTGLHGFGAVPSIQHFADEGDGATMIWDSALDTFTDDNANGAMDPGEYLNIGGWTHQPVAADAGGDPVLAVGSIDPEARPYDPYYELRLVDLALDPADPDFVIDVATGAGSTPALAGGMLYSIGPAGLVAFGPSCPADCDANGILNVLDFVCFQGLFQAGDPAADCDGSGTLTVLDFVCYQQSFVEGCGQ